MRRKILVELDALLDTRLGAMRVFNEGLWRKTWQDPAYYNRLLDDFEHFGQGITMMWRGIYDQRATLLDDNGAPKVLAASVMSLMPASVGTIIRNIYAKSIDHPTDFGADVYINVYPYKLDSQTCLEICLALEEQMIPGKEGDGQLLFDTKIETVDIPYAELDIHHCREDWNTIIMYNFGEWFDVQAKSIYESTKGAALTEFIVPELLRHRMELKDLRKPDGEIVNPFHETKRHLAISMTLNFWNAELFSLPNPYKIVGLDA